MTTNTFNGITLVRRDCDEWHLMWSALGEHKANRALSQPTVAEHFSEAWEYMETREVRTFGLRKRYFHFFRHRMHPTGGVNYRIRIPASQGFDSATLKVIFTR
ncbi:hypothetical protein GJ842_05595 [Salmonella enterica]|nr:hypothetical protein [Salmonella enterica]EDZ9927781.1 hypothetical protein [Salmonella enterica]EEB7432450.1 hypothetical protein [Salmonella enterica]EGC1287530.1 hypothetical protein [Salmonella enterica]EGF3844893.1 hypothetical protein [Salmonella enterica]